MTPISWNALDCPLVKVNMRVTQQVHLHALQVLRNIAQLYCLYLSMCAPTTGHLHCDVAAKEA